MTFKEYQSSAVRTMVDLGDLRLNLSHMVLGIISENEEFIKAVVNDDMINAKEEQCDIMWYVANYCNLRNFDLQEICDNMWDAMDNLEDWEQEVSIYDVYSSKLSDYVKKYIAYGKPLDEKLEMQALQAIVLSLTFEDTSLDFEVDLQKNIDKLKERYPDKFTNENALNRNLDAERKILEA